MNKEQKELVKQFEGVAGWEFMHKSELTGNVSAASFLAAWDTNIHWLEDVVTTTKRLSRAYELRHSK